MKPLVMLALLLSASGFGADPKKLLEASDRARGGLASPVMWNIDITSLEGGAETKRGFEITAQGANALAKATSPARNKGESFLFNDKSLWFYKPGLRKPVGISARQKLTGEAANGDIATTNYARDYTPTMEADEDVGGKPCHVLDLKAKNPSTTYDRIRYWIDKDSKLGVKAQFQTPEGKALKNATFEYNNKIAVNGMNQPFVSQMVIQDALMPSKKSTLKYDSPKTTKISESVFNVNSLMR